MQANLMGDTPVSEMEWNEPFFRDCFQVYVTGFNDGKGPAAKEGVQGSCQGCTFPRVACKAS
jgi:hypothetical protein